MSFKNFFCTCFFIDNMLLHTFPEHFSHISSPEMFHLAKFNTAFLRGRTDRKAHNHLDRVLLQPSSQPSFSCVWFLWLDVGQNKLNYNLQSFGLSMIPPGYPTTPDHQTCHFQLSCCYILLKTRNFRVPWGLRTHFVGQLQEGCQYCWLQSYCMPLRLQS